MSRSSGKLATNTCSLTNIKVICYSIMSILSILAVMSHGKTIDLIKKISIRIKHARTNRLSRGR